jgi:MarR family transcriptional regulator, 2-MHQ and catechol-resistance regulon repressor
MATRPLDDQRLTTVGLLFESSAGLRRLFGRQLEQERALPSQSMDVLIRLARTPGDRLRMSDLAAQASLTPSGLTRAIDRLQQQGLVTRQTCPEDRRGAFAVLTEQGRELMARVIPEHLAHIDAVLGGLFSAKEEEQLASALRRLRDYAFNELGGDAPQDEGCPSG